MNDLTDAVDVVMKDASMSKKYPDGLTGADVLAEVRARHGADAFPLVTILDVIEVLKSRR